MKKLLASFGWLVLLLPFISVAGTSTIINSSRFSDENRTVSNFNSVSSSGSFDVFIKMGSKESLRLEGDAEQLKEIETKVENGVLKIRYKRNPGNGWGFNRGKVNVYITAKSLSGLTVSGSGDMEIDGTLRAPKVDLSVSGSGSINLKTVTRTLNIAISGSGDITASGQADVSNIAISGSGEFEGKKLKTKETNARVSGSGEASVNAEKKLNAAISGSGDIFYSGDADVTVRKTGSGKVTKI